MLRKNESDQLGISSYTGMSSPGVNHADHHFCHNSASSYDAGNISTNSVPISTSVGLNSSLSSTTRAFTHHVDHHCQYALVDNADTSAKSPSFSTSDGLDSSLSSTSWPLNKNESNQAGISSSAGVYSACTHHADHHHQYSPVDDVDKSTNLVPIPTANDLNLPSEWA
eukprot:10541784-Ditylum_brightwellii.AAC.1